MNGAQKAARDAAIRQLRAAGALVKNIAADFRMSKSTVADICAGVTVSRVKGIERAARQSLRTAWTIPLDDALRAEIEAAKREQAPPYKAPEGWPA
jgi:hypothetical protein